MAASCVSDEVRTLFICCAARLNAVTYSPVGRCHLYLFLHSLFRRALGSIWNIRRRSRRRLRKTIRVRNEFAAAGSRNFALALLDRTLYDSMKAHWTTCLLSFAVYCIVCTLSRRPHSAIHIAIGCTHTHIDFDKPEAVTTLMLCNRKDCRVDCGARECSSISEDSTLTRTLVDNLYA